MECMCNDNNKSVVHMSAEVGGLNKGERPSVVPRPPPRFYLATKRSGRRPENEARRHPPLQTPPILSTLLCIVEWRGHNKN